MLHISYSLGNEVVMNRETDRQTDDNSNTVNLQHPGQEEGGGLDRDLG
jgi:hypothetical protein